MMTEENQPYLLLTVWTLMRTRTRPKITKIVKAKTPRDRREEMIVISKMMKRNTKAAMELWSPR